MYDYAFSRLDSDRKNLTEQIERLESDQITHMANGNHKAVESLTKMVSRLSEKRNSINAALALIQQP